MAEAQAFLAKSYPKLQIKIISGTRTYREQDKLFQKGRTLAGPKVTNAPGGHSNHNFGLAFDIGLFREGHYLEEGHAYADLGPVGEKIGFEWGGRWKRFEDEPHYEMVPEWAKSMKSSERLAMYRKMVSDNTDILA